MVQLDPTNYPYLITRACTDLPYTPAFSQLPDGFLRIVLKIVQKLDLQHPFKAVFAARATLAEESGKSIDNVHRAIKWMVDNKFLERERKANFGNRGSTSPLIPTLKLLQSIFLVDHAGQPIVKKNPRPNLESPKAEKQEMVQIPACQDNPMEDDQLPDADPGSEPEPTPEPPREPEGRAGRSQFVRIGTAMLPKDLAWLCTQGVSAFGVLALMKAARSVGQKLSDILVSARHYVEGLPSREMYAYLSKLIKSGRDFSAIAKKSEGIQKNEQNSEFLANKLHEMEGRSFISRKNQRVYRVMDGVLYEMRENASWTVHLISQGFIDAIHEGRLVPHRGQ